MSSRATLFVPLRFIGERHSRGGGRGTMDGGEEDEQEVSLRRDGTGGSHSETKDNRILINGQ